MARRSEVDAVGALCRALDCGDLGPLAVRLDDASVLRVPGSSGLAGDYQGREAIIGLLRHLAAATDGTLRYEVRCVLMPHPEALRIEGRMSGTRNGSPFSATVGVDATLVCQVFQSITIECADRSTWDTVWSGRARP
jgi:hypothetical protein